MKVLVTIACAALTALCTLASAKPIHPWVVDSPKLSPAAFFTNIKDGDSVSSPFVVRFGMNEWGLAPADYDLPKTGHHHLLINTDLPVPIDAPIAFSDNYRHFGKGQMETVLNLKKGKHTLRLLLANHLHVPHMVYSKQLTINVVDQTNRPLPVGYSTEPSVELLNPIDGQAVGGVFQVQFHASNYNIAHKTTALKGTGHFVLSIETNQNRTETIVYSGGETETWIKLPAGVSSAKFRLDIIDNVTKKPLKLVSKAVSVSVR